MSSPAERYAQSQRTAKRQRMELGTFQRSLSFELDDFQLDACEALEEGKGVLVAAPTGAGKTIVGQFAIHLALARNQKAFYTTPIKALSNQKFQELVELYGADRIGLLTGDTAINGEAQIVVMTTEVLRNMIYANSRTLTELGFVVMDEVHYLADRTRGAVWEEVIIHLPEEVKVVSLSATVSNAEEFGAWLGTVRGETRVIVSEHRPVPLHQHVYINGEILDLFTEGTHKVNPELIGLAEAHALQSKRIRDSEFYRGSSGEQRQGARGKRGRGRQARVRRGSRERFDPDATFVKHRVAKVSRPEVIQSLAEQGLLPAIFFIFSRVGCDSAVRQCLSWGLSLTTPQERREIREVVERKCHGIPQADLQVLQFNSWQRALEHGIAAHHAGLLPIFKETVEELFERGLVKAVFATETLALGVNMPARSVVLEKLTKFNGEKHVDITAGEYTQLTGRAGRRGIDTEGHAVIVWHHSMSPGTVGGLASRRTYPLNSSFRPTYNMAVNLISKFGRSRSREILESSFAQFQADRSVVGIAKRIRQQENALDNYHTAQAKEKDGKAKKRWSDRIKKLEKETRGLVGQLESRTNSISRMFDRICRVLTQLDYFKEQEDSRLQLTLEGNRLRRIYGEKDLLVAECVRVNAFEGLNAAEFASVAAALVYEGKRSDPGLQPRIPSSQVQKSLDIVLTLWSDIEDRESENHVPTTGIPDLSLVWPIYRWARGADLDAVLHGSDLSAGDFVRWCRQVIDLLDQLAGIVSAPDDPHEKAIEFIRARAQRCIPMIRKGIVDTAFDSSADIVE